MLVIDRRDDQGAYAPGANRAEVQAELAKHQYRRAGEYESTALPAQVEVETQSQMHGLKHRPLGVPCVVETPGPAVLVKLLLERIWGIDGEAQ